MYPVLTSCPVNLGPLGPCKLKRERLLRLLGGCVVAWMMLAMSLEFIDFPPVWGAVDAHSLWHLGTIMPTIIWYR